MQIIAFGLHKHNIPNRVWQSSPQNIDMFYKRIQPIVMQMAGSEFLFVNSAFAREVLAVVEEPEKIKSVLAAFFRDFLSSQPQDELFFHELEGPDSVKHFLQLSLGLEPVSENQQHEFLQSTQESIKIANDYNTIGPVIQRVFHSALMLRGKINYDKALFDFRSVKEQIKILIMKIFGDMKSLNFLVIGQNNLSRFIMDDFFPDSEVQPFIYKSKSMSPVSASNPAQLIIKDECGLEEQLRKSHVVFRMNQDSRKLFQPDNLNKIMHYRKNQPLLIINLDSTIAFENALSRIYNLYAYSVEDFQSKAPVTSLNGGIHSLIETELKVFFDWFYSKEFYRFGDIVAKSQVMENVLELIARISQTDITVLIQGESGTGKEIIARAIHQNSPRRDKAFVVVNSSALPDSLLESELFGHEKGAFTGAAHTKKGLFEEAHQGTIFLDEIGDTSPALQVKLLRVLQEGEIKRVGSNENIHIDVRLIAATNQNLSELVAEGKFRQDLYYRLNVVNLDIPALRERREDILPLAEFFRGKYADKMKKRVTGFSEHSQEVLFKCDWPGNVRELENAVERAVALAIGNIIHSHDLPKTLQQPGNSESGSGNGKAQPTLKDVEKEAIQVSLISHNWDYERVADILDIGRTTLWRKMKEYGISKNN